MYETTHNLVVAVGRKKNNNHQACRRYATQVLYLRHSINVVYIFLPTCNPDGVIKHLKLTNHHSLL